MLARILRVQLHMAAARRSHGSHMSLEAIPLLLLASVIGRRDGQEMILEIGMLGPVAAADEAAGLEMIGGARPRADEGPLHADEELAQRALHHRIEGDGLQAG